MLGRLVTSVDFGPKAFEGQARWLEMRFDRGGGVFTGLNPRRALAAPYAPIPVLPDPCDLRDPCGDRGWRDGTSGAHWDQGPQENAGTGDPRGVLGLKGGRRSRGERGPGRSTRGPKGDHLGSRVLLELVGNSGVQR